MSWFLINLCLHVSILFVCFKGYHFCIPSLEYVGEDIENFESNILDADESCDFHGREMQTFYCYNKGSCQYRLTNYNETHLKKEYYCICETVIYINYDFCCLYSNE